MRLDIGVDSLLELLHFLVVHDHVLAVNQRRENTI